jgi:hypothetical protein
MCSLVFQRFQMRDHFRGLSTGSRSSSAVASPVRLSHGRGVWKQQVHFNDLPVSGRAVAHPMIMRAEFVTEGIELLADLLAAFRIGVVEQAHRRPPR